MVQQVLRAVYKEVRGLHQAAYVLALFTFGSQLLALIRDRLLAAEFGAGIELDLYYAAFRVPDLLYVLFASTLSVYVLIPFVAERINRGGDEKAKQLLGQVFTLFLMFYSALACIAAVFAHDIVAFLFPGFVEYQADLVLLMRILLLQPFFLGISSLYGVVTQYQHRFVLYALSPLLYNIGIIIGLVFFYPYVGLSGLALGVVLGALSHLLVQAPFVLKSNLSPRVVKQVSFPDIAAILRVSIPRAVTLSLHQFVLLGMVGFASVMAYGSVSVFQFAFNLQSVPLAVIGMSYSVAAFPLLARLHAEGEMQAFGRHIVIAIRHIIFWSLPVVALIVVVRAQFVRVIFGSGAFDWDDTRLTAAVLALFIVSLTAQAIHLLVVRALYASGNTRLPFLVTLGSSVGALVAAFGVYVWMLYSEGFRAFLESLMRVEGVVGTEVLALPIGYSAALIVHVLVLLLLSERQLHFKFRAILAHMFEAIMAAIVAGGFAYGTLNFVVVGLKTETVVGIFLQGMLAGVVGLLGAVATYYVLKTPELFEVYNSIHKRIFKTDVVAPQDEDHLSV